MSPSAFDNSRRPVVWSIAGLDPSGCAGLAADVLTLEATGVHACPIASCTTAQHSGAVSGVFAADPEQLSMQLQHLLSALPPDAIKIGLIPNDAVLEVLIKFARRFDGPIVVDPVLNASSGTPLSRMDLTRFKRELLPHITLLTPNRQELDRLFSLPADDEFTSLDATSHTLWSQLQAACPSLRHTNLLLKGGHNSDEHFCEDWLLSKQQAVAFKSPRVPGQARGTGCRLSSAIAGYLALGNELSDAVALAKAQLQSALTHARDLKDNSRLPAVVPLPQQARDFPEVYSLQASYCQRSLRAFPKEPALSSGTILGLYPVVDNAEWIARLLPLGINIIQLRVKNLPREALEQEVARAVALGKQHQARVYINDHWQLAIKYGAYGVHLGQEDLDTADLSAIHAAGLRLGLSTHSYTEALRAYTLRPSYLAFGPIYATTTKVMRFEPQGLTRLKQFRRLFSDYPMVAIGGIDVPRAQQVWQTGVDSIAVVRAVTEAPELNERIAEFFAITGQGHEPGESPEQAACGTALDCVTEPDRSTGQAGDDARGYALLTGHSDK